MVSYLWGESAEAGDNAEVKMEDVQLDTHQDDDWVVVDQDKENSSHHSSQHTSHSYPHQATPIPIPQQIIPPSDLDLLDDAASLEHTDFYQNDIESFDEDNGLSDLMRQALNDCTHNFVEINSNYSSECESGADTESVFSLCSERSHGTYRPRGCSHRDPWIVAPPPCFTGSRAGELSTIASSPLENLLIEHPSMSVYLSFPSSQLSPSHPFHLAHLAGSPAAHTERRPSLELREEGVRSSTVNRRRREAQENHLGLNTKNQLTPAQVTKKMHLARRSQRKQNNKALSAHKLQRESRVLDKSFVKSNSCKNKNDRPSGMKAGRMAQRV